MFYAAGVRWNLGSIVRFFLTVGQSLMVTMLQFTPYLTQMAANRLGFGWWEATANLCPR
jgi:hypothetical protein